MSLCFTAAMIEHQVDMVMGVVDGQWVLTLDKREALAQFQQKHLHIVNQLFLQIFLLITLLFFYAKELKRIGVLHSAPAALHEPTSGHPVYPC